MRFAAEDRIFRWLGIAIAALGLLVLSAPIVLNILISFSETFTFPPRGFTTQWYENFLSRPEFMDGLQVSLVLAIGSALIASVIGLAASVVLVRYRFRGASGIRALLLSPVTLPRVALGISLFLFLEVVLSIRGAIPRLILLHLVLTTPYVISATSASLAGLDPSLEQAALGLGANRWEAFRRVTLPLARPGIVAGAIFAFVVSFDEVTASVFLTDARTSTFPVVLFAYVARGVQDPTIAAASTFMLLVVGTAVVLLGRLVGLGRALGKASR
jgi:putative spermidine/putrescine transport system permease protein